MSERFGDFALQASRTDQKNMRRDLSPRYESSLSSVSASVPGVGRDLAMRPAREASRHRRFVTQSHALGAPKASPRSLAVAAAVAVALFYVAKKLTD